MLQHCVVLSEYLFKRGISAFIYDSLDITNMLQDGKAILSNIHVIFIYPIGMKDFGRNKESKYLRANICEYLVNIVIIIIIVLHIV